MVSSTPIIFTAATFLRATSAISASSNKISDTEDLKQVSFPIRLRSSDLNNNTLSGIPLHNESPAKYYQKSMSGLPLRINNSTQQAKRSTVLQVRNPNFDGTSSGPAAHLKALKKHKGVIPKDLHNAVAKRSTLGSVSSVPMTCDSEYLSPVQIGTPAQTVHLDFDTGSSDLWVFSTNTDASQVNGQTLFNSSQSSTARTMTGSTFSVSYGDQSDASGNVIVDKVSVGGLTVDEMAVELASKVSKSFTSTTAADGILGLAFNSLNGILPHQQDTFINAASNMDTDVFTADLKRGAPGSYDFGHVNSSKYNGEIAYTPVNKNDGYWEFTATGYAVGNASFQSTPINAIADTGTSLILLPTDMVSSYYSNIDGATYSKEFGAMLYPCNCEVPSFTFGIGSNYKGVVPAEYMTYGQVNSTHCYGGIQDHGGVGYSIFGDVLLKSQFVVFDVGNTQIGFAAKELV